MRIKEQFIKQERLVKIMNRFWLKIYAVVVFVVVLLTVIAINFFRSPETKPTAETKPIAESKETRRIPKQDSRDLQTQPKMPSYDRDMSERYPDIARSKPPQLGQKQPHFTDEEIDAQYPVSLQSQKARDLLRNREKWGLKRYRLTDKGIRRQYPGVADSKKAGEQFAGPSQWGSTQDIALPPKKMGLQYPQDLQTKRSVERVRPEVPKGAELKLSEEQIEEIYERHLQYIIEQYKDNPKQAEEVRKLLLERLKKHREKRAAAAKEKKETPSK